MPYGYLAAESLSFPRQIAPRAALLQGVMQHIAHLHRDFEDFL